MTKTKSVAHSYKRQRSLTHEVRKSKGTISKRPPNAPTDISDFNKELNETKGTLVTLFYDNAFVSLNSDLKNEYDELAKDFKGKARFVKLNVDGNPEVAAEQEI